MVDGFAGLDPVVQAFLATLMTWFLTAVGAAVVFVFPRITRTTLETMLGFASGVMIAASFWSLLAPAIEIASARGGPPWLPAASGFLLGVFTLLAVDRPLPHLHRGQPRDRAEGPRTSCERSVLLVLAVTLHNVPEGLAVGVAFGALAADPAAGTLGGAVALALGIGIQNLPEGTAVSVPLHGEGLSRGRSFWYGQLSGMVEPMAGVAGHERSWRSPRSSRMPWPSSPGP